MARKGKARQDMKIISKARHGNAKKGLVLHVIFCYKSYLVEKIVFIPLILNKASNLCFFSCNPK
jgi:hypothetical protein